MSLINKMLQDLEERSPEAAQINSLHPSIRLAPARRRIHPAWLVAIAATTAFVLALVGFPRHKMHARIAEMPLIVQQAQLPLKMADSLSIPAPQAVEDRSAQASMERETADVQGELAPVEKASVEKDTGDDRKELKDVESVTFSSSPKLPSRLNSEAIASPRIADSAVSERGKAIERRSTGSVAGKTGESVFAVTPGSHDSDSSVVNAAKQVHELSPHEKAENEYRKAAGLIQQGRSDEAITTLQRGLAFDPRHAGARQTLIGLLLAAGRTDDAMSTAKEGLSLDNTQIGLAMILARLQVDKGDLQHAVDTLQRSLPSGVENAEYQAFYAALMQRSGNHKEAIAHYAVALRMMPQSGVWWMGMGISLQAEDRIADAKDAYARAKSSGNLSSALVAFVDQRLAQLQR